jgi:hypothetical protein
VSLTDHLRTYLETGEPTVALLGELAALVRRRIRALGMWGQPPRFLGYPDFSSWDEAFNSEDMAPGPVADFFLERIVPDLDYLGLTIRAGNRVEALLYQKIGFFLTDRQKKNDPVGYRAFKNLAATLEAMETDGVANLSNRVRGKVRNPTVVRLAGPGPGGLTDERDLAAAIDRDEEWQSVILRLSKLGIGAQRLLRARLDRLTDVGISAFQVGDLGRILKDRARQAHEAWNRQSEAKDGGENADEIRTDPGLSSYSTSEETLNSLDTRVRIAIAESGYTAKVKRGMELVLNDWLRHLRDGRRPPPLSEWSAQLGLSRSSLGDYRKRLEDLLRTAVSAGQFS